jgi:diguanylate cyclase (GGDEF)-like protein
MLRTICERIRARVETQQPEHLKLSGKITVSIGAAIANLTLDRDGWVDTLKRSDQALYQAKQAGRNTVIIDAT